MQNTSSGHSAMVYFDNAATSLQKPSSVGQAMLNALNACGNAGRGGHPATLEASRCVFKTRKAVAELMGSAPERTIFTANATESLNIAITGLLTPNDHVITTVLEHNSVLRPLYRLRTAGMGLSIVKADKDGMLDYASFYHHLRPNTKALVCTHASNVTGAVIDLNYLSKFCQENNLLLILDASQTAGVLPLDADHMGIDVLCFTGHKNLFGPQGTGGLCVREGLNIPPLKVGGSGHHSFSENHPMQLPESLEAGTLNMPGLAGLLAGIEYIQATGMEQIRNRELALSKQFQTAVQSMPGITIYGPKDQPTTPIVTLNVTNLEAGIVGAILADQYNICVRTGAHCAPLAHTALGTKDQGAVRFSFSFFNTEEEIQTGIRALSQIAHT